MKFTKKNRRKIEIKKWKLKKIFPKMQQILFRNWFGKVFNLKNKAQTIFTKQISSRLYLYMEWTTTIWKLYKIHVVVPYNCEFVCGLCDIAFGVSKHTHTHTDSLDLYGEHKVQKLNETRDKYESQVRKAYTHIYKCKNTGEQTAHEKICVLYVFGLSKGSHKETESDRDTESVEWIWVNEFHKLRQKSIYLYIVPPQPSPSMARY